MKMITKKIEKELKKYPLYSQDGKGDEAKVIIKYFTPWTSATWYVLEGEQLDDGDYEFFGICALQEWEYGYFRLSQLEAIRGPWGLKVERDLYTEGYTVKQLKNIGEISEKIGA